LMTRIGAQTSEGQLLFAYFLFGFGFGFVNPPITNTAVSGMPAAQAGVAAAVASTSRQVGATLGVAVVGAVAATSLSGALGADFVQASRPAWWIITGLGVIVFVLGLLSTTRRAMATADPFREALAAES
ncbi:MAG: MFS transporter, partial [Solirubrobacteraceae bacterium]